MELLFWISVALIIYPSLGYPLVLSLLRAISNRPVRRAPCTPDVTMLITA